MGKLPLCGKLKMIVGALLPMAMAGKPVIAGWDVVEYFSLNSSALGVQGSPEWAYNFTSPDADGSPRFTYEFWFTSEANKEKFIADPWKYAPKYGGF